MKLQQTTRILLFLAAGAWPVTCQTTINSSQAKMGGPAASRPLSCVAGQIWLANDTGTLSYCSSTGDPGTWKTLTNSGVSTGSDALCSVPLNGTPVFDASQCSAFQLTLGETTVTASSLVNARAGQNLVFLVSQDSTGGRSFVWPSNVMNGCAISSVPGIETIVEAIFDGSNANVSSCSTTDDGTLLTGPTRNAPGTPLAGLSCWFDALASGGGTWKCKDTNGNVRAAVLTASAPTTNEFVTYIDDDGVTHTAPVAEEALSLSDTTTGDATPAKHGFLPRLPGDSSKCLLGDGTYGACGTGGGGTGGGYTMNSGGAYEPLNGVFSILHAGVSWQVAPQASNGHFECFQWTAPVGMKVSNLFTLKGGNSTSAHVFVAAIYTDDSNTPGSKVANSDAVVVGNTGVGYVFTPWGGQPTLPAGPYWMCYSHSNAAANWYTDPDSTMPTVLGNLLPPRRVACQNTVTYNGSGTTLPSTCDNPAVMLSGALPYVVIAQ